MGFRFIVSLLTLTFIHQILMSSTGFVYLAPTNDLYSEAPCELRPLSAFKDAQGNVWGVGEGNLWWFNATNLSWSLLPMPNGTASSDPWRVACVDPRKYVAIVGRNASLVLHLPWQHWQFGDTDDVNVGYVDKDATWCVQGLLYGIDSLRETLYVLDVEEAHWSVRDDLPVMTNTNWSNHHGLVNVWVGLDGELIMVESNGLHDHVMYTNTSAINWIIMAENNSTNVWPNLNQSIHGRSLTWNSGSDHLWLWKEDNGLAELWSFSYNSSKWTKGNPMFSKQLPSLRNVLTGWAEDDKYCVLKRSSECTSQYSVSDTQCFFEKEMISGLDQDLVPSPRLTTSSTTFNSRDEVITVSTKLETATGTDYTSTTHAISAPTTTTIPASSRSIPVETKRLRKPVVTTKHDPDWKNDEKDAVVAISPSRDSKWHQHTSVFGSVIFFGTSITIFAVFGMFWCVRKCVHFPKEALLLRDPPSVRYTAIPDSLGYDSRKPTPATYTVIPDSIA